ncbi:YfkD famly protein [Metabacillus fastidiosus]|uniref:YfkD famly protein n=1 Tax=Metabacillus fastidiosus TaxID=1458 RepID=UPI000825C379|nr:YfkD famly protein [Metabacillus fastidiosus]MED4460969.1 YfkD family protein [Metabacillus fastidiosus]
MKKVLISLVLLLLVGYSSAVSVEAKIPSGVKDISKENTYPNPTQDLPYLQPSELAQQLVESANVPIENPDLIRLLNESSVSGSPVAVGYRATVFLGHWALNYESGRTAANWEYEKINTNVTDNRGGERQIQNFYRQEAQKRVTGGLTAKIPEAEHVKKMMLLKAMKKTNLPLSFDTIVGAGTKQDHVYNIPPKKMGYLYAYAPAINEKGKVTYGEVYLVLRGNKQKIIVKNVTSQGIGAWIPIQDHVSFRFSISDRPR